MLLNGLMNKFVCSIEIDGLDELISSIALFRPIDEFDGSVEGLRVSSAENSVVIADARRGAGKKPA
jgi:hypothetical protein